MALQEPTLKTLPLARIVRDEAVQARVGLSQRVVDEYAERLVAGDTFPPVDVYYDGETYHLADGFHRVGGAEKAGRDVIEVLEYQGDKRAALFHAIRANATHGLPRTNADKRKAVMLLLQDAEWREWSDNEIARQTKTSQPFVAKLRRSIFKRLKIPPWIPLPPARYAEVVKSSRWIQQASAGNHNNLPDLSRMLSRRAHRLQPQLFQE